MEMKLIVVLVLSSVFHQKLMLRVYDPWTCQLDADSGGVKERTA